MSVSEALGEANCMTQTKKQPNNYLRRERELKGWSQRMLAERLGSNEHVVSRWEKGLHTPNRYFQTQLCQLFGKSAEELGFMTPKEETTQEMHIDEEQSVKRRDFLSLSGLVSTTLANPFHSETFQQVSALLDTQPFTLQSVDEFAVTLWQSRNNAAFSIEVLYTHYLFSFDSVLLDGYKGTCLQYFYHKSHPNTYSYLSEAKEALSRALAANTPARRKLYYLGDFAQAEARQGEVEASCEYAFKLLEV